MSTISHSPRSEHGCESSYDQRADAESGKRYAPTRWWKHRDWSPHECRLNSKVSMCTCRKLEVSPGHSHTDNRKEEENEPMKRKTRARAIKVPPIGLPKCLYLVELSILATASAISSC
jgi:hypothetical protein